MTTTQITKAVRPGGIIEFHAAGCQAASKGGAQTTTEARDAGEFAAFQSMVEAEARDLGVPRSEQQTRFHACLRKGVKA